MSICSYTHTVTTVTIQVENLYHIQLFQVVIMLPHKHVSIYKSATIQLYNLTTTYTGKQASKISLPVAPLIYALALILYHKITA